MARLLLADVTLIKKGEVKVHVRFKGGATHSLALPLPKPAWKRRRTPQQVVREVDKLLDAHTDREIADILQSRGHRLELGRPFTSQAIAKIRATYSLKSRYDRLRDAGLLTMHEVAERLGVHWSTVKTWRNQGLLLAVRFNDKGECLYPDPGPTPPTKQQGLKLSERPRHPEITSNHHDEVQYET